MSQIAKVVYTAKTDTTGGRENGAARSSDGLLDIRLSTPGSARIGTNPEQLFAAGWSACFESAIALAARKRKIALPAADCIVGVGQFLRGRLRGLLRHEARGHKSCTQPLERATPVRIVLHDVISLPV